jgi:hypothetical protein
VAGTGVVENTVGDAVPGIAGGTDGFADGWQFRDRNARLRREMQLFLIGGASRNEGRPVVRWRAGQDAIVVSGKALGFHERLSTAIGAGCEVRMLRGFLIKGGDDLLGLQGHIVDGTPAEVFHFLRMTQGEG